MFNLPQKNNTKLKTELQTRMVQKKDYIKEYIYIIALAVLFCLLVTIFTYDPSDPSTFHRISNSQQKISNYFGPFGASLADWAFQIFGLGAIIFLIAFLVQLLHTFRRPIPRSRIYLKIFGYPQLILFYLGFVSGLKPFTNYKGIQILTGGIIGNKVFDVCVGLFGNQAAMIVLFLGVLSSLTLCIGITPLSSVLWLLKLAPFKQVKNFREHITSDHNPILNDLFEGKVHFEKNFSPSISHRTDQNVFLDLISVLEVKEPLSFKHILQSLEFQRIDFLLPLICGKMKVHDPFVIDLVKLPNLLIMDASKSGKNECVNILMLSLILNKPPSELKLLLIDFKMLEFANYDAIGHLIMPVVTSTHRSISAFGWLAEEMERRYSLLKHLKVRNFFSLKNYESLPYLVMIISELYDLVLSIPYELEENLQKLLHKAHLVGIHLIFSTKKSTLDIPSNSIQSSFSNSLCVYKNKTFFVREGREKPLEIENIHISSNEIEALTTKLRNLYPFLGENIIMK